jgi:hypothetical protein
MTVLTSFKRTTAMAKIGNTSSALDNDNASSAAEVAAQVSQAQVAQKELKDAENTVDIDSLFENGDSPMAVSAPRSHADSGEVDGFSDLDDDIGFGSFPIIKLENGKLVLGEAGEEVESFLAVILGMKRRYLYKSEPGDDAEIFYSYDKQVDTSGRSVESRLAEWEADGHPKEKFEIKEYVELMAQLKSTAFTDRLCMLSIPPASIKRLSGYRQELKYVNGTAFTKCITKVSVGKKIKYGTTTFNPWQFDFDSLISK